MQDPGSPPVVLVVDDDDAVRRVTVRALQTYGYTAIGAINGFDAVDAISTRELKVACAIVDMSMPGLDGEATMLRLRAIDADLPVLLASGHSAEEMEEKFGGTGFIGYLQKPFELEQLANDVSAAIASRGGGAG